MMARPPPAPAPSQYAKYRHQLKVGVFVATLEVMHDQGDMTSLEAIRDFAQQEAKHMMYSVGDEPEPAVLGEPVCDMARIHRELKKMSWHVEYFEQLCNKFVDDYDCSPRRTLKVKEATGYLKGIMARDGQRVFNITDTPTITDPLDWLNIFKVNARLFIAWLRSYQYK